LKSSGEKAPLKYVEQIDVEEFTMGMVPPRFHFCHARYNPTRNYLQLEADMGFRSAGFQLVVRSHSLGQLARSHLSHIPALHVSTCTKVGFSLAPESSHHTL